MQYFHQRPAQSYAAPPLHLAALDNLESVLRCTLAQPKNHLAVDRVGGLHRFDDALHLPQQLASTPRSRSRRCRADWYTRDETSGSCTSGCDRNPRDRAQTHSLWFAGFSRKQSPPDRESKSYLSLNFVSRQRPVSHRLIVPLTPSLAWRTRLELQSQVHASGCLVSRGLRVDRRLTSCQPRSGDRRTVAWGE